MLTLYHATTQALKLQLLFYYS